MPVLIPTMSRARAAKKDVTPRLGELGDSVGTVSEMQGRVKKHQVGASAPGEHVVVENATIVVSIRPRLSFSLKRASTILQVIK